MADQSTEPAVSVRHRSSQHGAGNRTWLTAVILSRKLYVDVMTNAREPYWPRTFIEPDRLGRGRLALAWLHGQVWARTMPLLAILFALLTPFLLRQRDTPYLWWVVSLSIVSLTAVLAVVDRYVLVLEPLLGMAVCVGTRDVRTLAGPARRSVPASK